MLSFLNLFPHRGTPPPTEPQPGASPAAADNPTPLTALPSDSPLNDAIARIFKKLSRFLPEPSDGIPQPHISVIEVKPRPVAIGNLCGLERRGSFEVVSLKGIRLEALLRFQLWADTLPAVDDQIRQLQISLLTAGDTLRKRGFLQLHSVGGTPAEHVSALPAWRKTTDYRVLYEHHYTETDASGLITRIPVDQTAEVVESMLVTGRVVRWDELTAPALRLPGRTTIRALELLAYQPGPPPLGTVTLLRSFRGAAGPPTPFPSLADLLTALADGERHARFTFPTLESFIAACTAVGDPIALGDMEDDRTLDTYQYRTLDVFPPIQLDHPDDFVELAYGSAQFNTTAALYVQIT